MKKIVASLFLFLFVPGLFAAVFKGKVTDVDGNALPFVNVYLKGTTKGTTTNMDGKYSLTLDQGEYEIMYRYIGYKIHEEKVSINSEVLELDIVLQKEAIKLEEFTVESDAEDPAYRVIRAAIKKRKYHLKEVEAFSCNVYIKGLQRITEHPDKIMGIEVNKDALGIIDTTTNIVYLSESVSEFHYQQPNRVKEVMISSKVSGNNRAFSYNQASDMLFNFYEGHIELEGLSERGFISPIAGNALLYYKYMLVGSFYENGNLVNKIKVIPKRKSDPVFRGHIYIIEDSWRIHSAKLLLTKDANIDFVDSLMISQVHLPLKDSVWMPFSNRFDFTFKVFGFTGSGVYTGVHADYEIDPKFPKKFFGNELMKVNDDANKRDSSYWETSRPVPLTDEEEEDYRLRDSIMKYRQSAEYLDSVDQQANKFKWNNIFLGYTYYKRSRKLTYFLDSPLGHLQFNTVQGWVAGLGGGFRIFNQETGKFFRFQVPVSYGFSNETWNVAPQLFYYYKPQKFSRIGVSGGVETKQFNRNLPMAAAINSSYTLFNEQNFAKFYLNKFGRIWHSTELVNGLVISSNAEFADRSPMQNKADYVLIDRDDREYTSNDPRFPNQDSLQSFQAHQSLRMGVELRLRIKQRYYTRPHRKIIIGSKYPTLLVKYEKGIKGVVGSDTDYDFVKVGIQDDVKLKLLGTSSYAVSYGRFLNKNRLPFMDYHHFNGNQIIFSVFDLQSFNLLEYYKYSTNDQYLEAHFEHDFGAFILNKVPLLRKLKLNELAGLHYLTSDTLPNYLEVFVGVEKLEVFRIDFVTAYAKNNQINSGIRVGVQLQ